MSIDLEVMFSILADKSRKKGIMTYTELSDEYYKRTNDAHDPHGTWDEPLGELNRILHALNWPPISAVVVLKETNEPGGKFWGSSPSIPPCPKNDIDRVTTYAKILSRVHAANWPSKIPLTTP